MVSHGEELCTHNNEHQRQPFQSISIDLWARRVPADRIEEGCVATLKLRTIHLVPCPAVTPLAIFSARYVGARTRYHCVVSVALASGFQLTESIARPGHRPFGDREHRR